MAENVNDPFVQRIAQVDQQGKADKGEHWEAAMRGHQKRMQRDDPAHVDGSDAATPADLAARVVRSDAVGRLFSDGIANADEKDWRAWRDSLPDRQRWKDRTR
jgi:hypothetical protein